MARKKIKEIRLEEYLGGFWACLEIFETKHRELFNAEWQKAIRNGRSTLISDLTTPEMDLIWECIDKANKTVLEKSREHTKLMQERCKLT